MVDIYEFFVTRISYYTHEELRSYKALSAYNALVSGWVSNVRTTILKDHHLVMCEVMHSMKVKEKNLVPWVILDSDHRILSGHCTCMAGLDEACTHIAALLFYTEYMYSMCSKRSVTDTFAYWKPSCQSKNIAFKRMKEIELAVPEKIPEEHLRRKSKSALSTPQRLRKKEPDKVKLVDFFGKMKSVNPHCVFLKILAPFCFEYSEEEEDVSPDEPTAADRNDSHAVPVPVDSRTDSTAELDSFPCVLTKIYSVHYEPCTYEELVCLAHSFDFSMFDEFIFEIEARTRAQSACPAWFEYRKGRITGFVMKEVCCVRSSTSNRSVIQKICDPKNTSTPAIRWGKQHETTAVNCYIREQQKVHINFQAENCGFFIFKRTLFIGASPDRLTECACCGKGILEVKCPFSLADGKKDVSSLSYMLDGHLNEKDAYYYQLQTEVLCTGLRHADFCIWGPSTLYIERVYFDENFCEEMVEKASTFFYEAVMPELLAKYFTRHPPKKEGTRKTKCPVVENKIA